MNSLYEVAGVTPGRTRRRAKQIFALTSRSSASTASPHSDTVGMVCSHASSMPSSFWSPKQGSESPGQTCAPVGTPPLSSQHIGSSSTQEPSGRQQACTGSSGTSAEQKEIGDVREFRRAIDFS